jgi:hypothetical protein
VIPASSLLLAIKRYSGPSFREAGWKVKGFVLTNQKHIVIRHPSGASERGNKWSGVPLPELLAPLTIPSPPQEYPDRREKDQKGNEPRLEFRMVGSSRRRQYRASAREQCPPTEQQGLTVARRRGV